VGLAVSSFPPLVASEGAGDKMLSQKMRLHISSREDSSSSSQSSSRRRKLLLQTLADIIMVRMGISTKQPLQVCQPASSFNTTRTCTLTTMVFYRVADSCFCCTTDQYHPDEPELQCGGADRQDLHVSRRHSQAPDLQVGKDSFQR
jgi:hypothetical protein